MAKKTFQHDIAVKNIIEAGESGTAGSMVIYPSTTNKGSAKYTCSDQTGDTQITLNTDAHGQITTVHIPDFGASDSYLVQAASAVIIKALSTSKALITDSNGDIDTGATTSTEIGYVSGVTSSIQTQLNSKIESGDTIDNIIFDPTAGTPSHSEGLVFYDNVNNCLAYFNDVADVTMQVGQEIWVRVYNDTGSVISNGEVCYLTDIFSGVPSVDLAKADDASTCLATLGMATHDIADQDYGYITRLGTVRDIDTLGCSAGAILYLSAGTAGGYTTTRPSSPNFTIRLGNCGVVSATVGTIEIQINIGDNLEGVISIFNGSILEQDDQTVTSNGTVVTFSIEKEGSGDLNLFFDGGFYTFTAPPATIALTPGSDVAPTENFVYIPKSTKVLTVSTTSFPSDEQIIPLATILCQSAASVQTDGLIKHHAWTDHVADSVGQGHILHVNEWIREQHATWKNGVAPTTSVTTNPGAIDNVYFSNTSGVVYQLHKHTFQAKDMGVSDIAYVVNDFTTKYDRIADLGAVDTTSTGATLRSNNTYYSVVVIGVVSENSSTLLANAPAGFYTSAIDATDDISGYSNYSIGNNVKGTAFLIARITLRYQTITSGTFTEIETEDLRGLLPATSAGGGGGAGGPEFSDNLFRVTAVGDSTSKLAYDVSAIATATVRTLTVLNEDMTLVGLTNTQTLTGKTFTSPVINVGSDAHGDVYFRNTSGIFTRLAPGVDGQFLKTQGAAADVVWSTPAGGGDVLGPATNADNALARYDGINSKTIQNSGILIDDSDNISGINNITGADTNLCTGTAGTEDYTAKWNVDGDLVDGYDFLDEDDMSSDSAVSIASQQSVKYYVDTRKGDYDTIDIDAGAMTPTNTDGAFPGTNEYATNDINWDYFAFDSGATEEKIQFKTAMPESWNGGTVKAKFYWSSAAGSSIGDTVEWGIKAGALSDSDAIDVSLGTPQTVSDAITADNGADVQLTGATSSITIGGSPSAGDITTFEVYRNTDGTDDMAEDAWLFKVVIQFQNNSAATGAWS